MFKVERNEIELIVRGPEGFEKRLPCDAVGVVIRAIDDEDPEPCTLLCGRMSDAEAVACALGIPAF
jgi:hypothetical protein